MTVSARTVETNAADALTRLFSLIGDTDNAATWTTEFERAFSSPLVRVLTPDDKGWTAFYAPPGEPFQLVFEDGSVLHLTVTQIKEPNPDA